MQVLPKMPGIEKEVWLTCTEEMRGNARIRAMYDFLANLIGENRHLLAGTQPYPETSPPI